VRFIASSYGSHNVLVNSQDALVHALSQKGLTLAGFFVDHGDRQAGRLPTDRGAGHRRRECVWFKRVGLPGVDMEVRQYAAKRQGNAGYGSG